MLQLDSHPFGTSPVWPPLDNDLRPRPALVAVCAVLTTVLYRLFYRPRRASHLDAFNAKTTQTRLAQLTALLANQQSHFLLDREQAEALLEADPAKPKVYEDARDLTVKQELRVTAEVGGGRTVDTAVKGRKLTAIGGREVATTHDVDAAFAELQDADYP